MTTDSAQAAAWQLRQTATRFATGVTVVAITDPGGVYAMTANSFITLSLEPPLIGVAVRLDGGLLRRLRHTAAFGISVLDGGQATYARRYADPNREGLSAELPLLISDPPCPVPLVPGCVATFSCEHAATHRVGDHDLVVGTVLACEVRDSRRAPLIFLDERLGAVRAEQE